MVGPLLTDSRSHRKHALGRFAKGDRNDSLTLGEAFAGTQEKRHPGPAPIIDGAFQRDEGFGVRVRGDALFRSIADVLAADTSSGLMGSMLRNTLFFSSLMGAGSSAVGGSMAMKPKI